MGVRASGAAVPAIEGSGALQRWQEWIVEPGYHESARDTGWLGHAFGRHLPTMWNAGNPNPVWRSAGGQGAIFRVLDAGGQGDLKVIEFRPTAVQECVHDFRPTLTAAVGADFIATFPAQAGAVGVTPPPLAWSIMAWVRKMNAADATGARQFVGFLNNNGDVNFSRRVSRIGVMGDGAQGFRFGSVNCPDAIAGGAQNAQGDIDANAISPADIASPGIGWFHVRVKMIPPTPQEPQGKFAVYLNGSLAGQFAAAANFPRTSRSSIDVSGAAYWPIIPTVAVWNNPDGITVDPGLYVRDLRVRMEEDRTV